MKKIILSDNKLNLLVDDVTNALLRQKPTPTGSIPGGDITQFCPHNQVNQFILFRVYQDANGYLAQLNHAYFDFSAAEVKEELRRLLAVLSRNILVREGDFKTLLRAAVYNTLRLILNPEDTLLGFFFGNSDSIPIELYRRNAVYFSDFDFIVRSILSWYEKNELNRVERDVFQEKMGRVVELFERKEGRSMGEYQRGLFKSLTGKDLDAVMGMAASTIEERKEPETQQPVVEEQKKPLISVRPREREQNTNPVTEQPPVNREPKTTLPPWVEQKQPPVVEEEAKPSVFSRSSTPPRSETPPWVEKKTPTRQEPVILDPVTPLPDEEAKPVAELPKVETPRVETPKVEMPTISAQTFDTPRVETPRVETPKVEPVIETPKVETPRVEPPQVETPAVEERKNIAASLEQKEEKRSLNAIFSNKDKERNTILDRSKELQDKQRDTTVDSTVKSIMDRLTQEKEQKAVAETPRVETPRVETPRVDPPKVESPVVQPPVVETPRVEVPRVETPQVEIPKVETPRAEPPVERPFITPPGQGEGKTTIAGRFKESSGTLADSLAAKNIRTEQIPVHKQFQFVQKVFGGSSVKFKVILDKINKTTTAAEAEEVLEKYVFNDPNVNRNDKVAKEFEQLVRARFE